MKTDFMGRRAERLFRYVPYILLALVLVVVFCIRLRLLAVPLERDEGEFAYMGQLLLKGISPFTHAYTLKLPGVSILYAFFMFLFGQTAIGIHAGLLIVNGICIFLVYLLAKQFFDNAAAIYSCASYAVLSLSSSVYGLHAHATHFVMLFVLTGLLFLLRSIDKRQISLLFASGFCFGLAVTMKQHAALLFIFAFLYFVWRIWESSPTDKKYFIVGSFILLLGVIIPYAMIVLWMVKTGSFDAFWFWTVQYASEYSSTQTLAVGWSDFKFSVGKIAKLQLPLWILAGFGCALLFMKKKCCADRLFVFGFLLFSFLAICPGLFFREHYFILFLPAVAIMVGAGISEIGFLLAIKSTRLTSIIPVFLFILAITYGFYQERDDFFAFTPLEVVRATFGANPFPEALEIASYIKNNSAPDDKIAVLGSEPEIYFYANRLSATGHIYMYGLMENQPYAEQMQEQMIREIEVERPKIIVFVKVDASWLAHKSSNMAVINWGLNYAHNLYDQVGVVDIIGLDSTRYLWDKNAVGYTPVSRLFVTVFKRKNGV